MKHLAGQLRDWLAKRGSRVEWVYATKSKFAELIMPPNNTQNFVQDDCVDEWEALDKLVLMCPPVGEIPAVPFNEAIKIQFPHDDDDVERTVYSTVTVTPGSTVADAITCSDVLKAIIVGYKRLSAVSVDDKDSEEEEEEGGGVDGVQGDGHDNGDDDANDDEDDDDEYETDEYYWVCDCRYLIRSEKFRFIPDFYCRK
jgi:hypothetical protein